LEVAKALGGSFKLVTLAPRTVREMTQLPKETQKNGDRQTYQKAQMNKQKLSIEKHTRSNQAV